MMTTRTTRRRPKGMIWDFNGDGRFAKDRYTRFDKRYLRRKYKRLTHKIDQQETIDYENSKDS